MQIGLFRESGGLGDVVMTGGAVKRLKSEGHNVYFIGFNEYRDAIDHIGYDGMYALNPGVRNRRRKRNDLLRVNDMDYFDCLKWLPLDRVYDMFCPGYNHEEVSVSSGISITINRTEAFQIVCGYVSNFVRAEWIVTDREMKIAQMWLDFHKIKNEKCITIHARATEASRSYPKIKQLCLHLKERGYQPLLIDSVDISACKEYVDYIWEEPLWLKAAIIKLSNKFIGIDSGFLHIAAALGVKIVSLWGPTNARQTAKLYETNTSIVAKGYNEIIYDGNPKADKEDVVLCKPPCIHAPVICRNKTGCKYLHIIDPDYVIDVLEEKINA